MNAVTVPIDLLVELFPHLLLCIVYLDRQGYIKIDVTYLLAFLNTLYHAYLTI